MAEETIPTTRLKRKTRTGVVKTDKMQKTVTVTLTRRFAHAVYGKMMTRTITVKARDEHGAKVGDTVRLMETRPLAKTVNWRVTEIVKRAK
ncbi:MAG: 30S ribosomal protein S17 [Gemmatimonadales bacterium]|jgi:small subunit ribosomal protein S17|nr:MAG: 30S ribosomal protein S17 [Gemmatimonadales bacterium]